MTTIPHSNENEQPIVVANTPDDPLTHETVEENEESPLPRILVEFPEAKQIFQNLSAQHARVLQHAYAIDTKIAQGIAFNGVILSFVFDKYESSAIPGLFLVGVALILISMFVGIHCYTYKLFNDSPSPEFYEKCNEIDILKMELIEDIQENDPLLKSKAKFFNINLWITFSGLLIVITSYYLPV